MCIRERETLEKALSPFAFGKREIIRLLQIAVLTGGHLLIEDLPGVGKTTLAKAFSATLGRSFSRISGTSDTLPGDILGGEFFNPKTREFSIKKGPIFSEVVLIDEINRMHPKAQSAFLEAMEEKAISLDGVKYELPKVHLVVATQNPIEYAGTYPLPEAQRDRFFAVLRMGFPERELQKKILQNGNLVLEKELNAITPLLTESRILELRNSLKTIKISDEIVERVLRLAEWSRNENLFRYGISPRGLSLFCSGLRANALLNGRDFVIPEDGTAIAGSILAHRLEPLDATTPRTEIEKMVENQYKSLFL